MNEEFQIEPEHLIRPCDAILSNSISPGVLQPIAFCMIASDNFEWDSETDSGDVVSRALFDWSAPEINYPLTTENVRLARERLARKSSD
jgi:hypothetical protein